MRMACNLQLDDTLPATEGQFDGLAEVLPLAEHERILRQVDLPLQPHVQRPEKDYVIHMHATLAKGDTAQLVCLPIHFPPLPAALPDLPGKLG